MAGFELWRLRREQKRSNEEYSKYIGEAKDREDAECRISEAMDARNEIRDKIMNLRSLQISEDAEDLGIPVPPLADKESWEGGRTPGTVRLTKKAQLELLHAIRIERREKWEVFAFVLKDIVTPVMGLLGVIMGLISLVHAIHSK